MVNKVIMLGCGGSSGIPAIGSNPLGNWGTCDPKNQKNHRTRSSVYIEYCGNRILIDTGPDFRQQYLKNKLTGIDAVIITHVHSDHIAGINELRSVFLAQNQKPIPVYGNTVTFKYIRGSYNYLFEKQADSTVYPVVLEQNIVSDEFYINNHKVTVMEQPHGDITSLGIRIGNFAYSTDFHVLPEESLAKLHDLDVWILDCLIVGKKHFSHNHFEQAMEYINFLKPKKAIFTHMSKYLDYEKLKQLIPKGLNIEPGYDGMVIEF